LYGSTAIVPLIRALIYLVALVTLSAVGLAKTVPFSVQFTDRGFEEIAVDRGVRAYRHPSSKVVQIGAEGMIPAPPETVVRALTDYDQHVGRLPRVAESRVLRRGPNWIVAYQRLKLPVISDRDFTLHVRIAREGEVTAIRFEVTQEGGPGPRNGVVRIKNYRGSWQLKATGQGDTLARFQSTMDLGGWVPMWLARSGAAKELPDFYSSLCRFVCRREKCSSNCR
jgi:hypothetical protein